MATLGGQTITRAEIRIPRLGDWWADVSTDSGEVLAVGSRVQIVIDGLTLSGAIVRGGISGDVGRYQVQGRPEWALEVAALGYRSASSTKLTTVVEDLSRDVLGTSFAALIVKPSEKSLGTHWERPGSDAARGVVVRARDVLAALGLSWYVRADGVTVMSERPTGNVASTASARIRERNLTLGMRIVGTENPEAFVPGLTFDGETISEVVIRVSADDYLLDVWAEPNWFQAAVAAIIRRVFPDLFFRGCFVYQVVGPSLYQPPGPFPPDQALISWKYDMRPVNSRWLPEAQSVELWAGAAGHAAELRPGTRVLLAFADADPSQPRVVSMEPAPGPDGIGRPVTAHWHAGTERRFVDEVSRVDAGQSVQLVAGQDVTIEVGATKLDVLGVGVRVNTNEIVGTSPDVAQVVTAPFVEPGLGLPIDAWVVAVTGSLNVLLAAAGQPLILGTIVRIADNLRSD